MMTRCVISALSMHNHIITGIVSNDLIIIIYIVYTLCTLGATRGRHLLVSLGYVHVNETLERWGVFERLSTDRPGSVLQRRHDHLRQQARTATVTTSAADSGRPLTAPLKAPGSLIGGGPNV